MKEESLTRVTEVVMDGRPESTLPAGNAETAARIAGNPDPNKIFGTNSAGVQTWLDPTFSNFPKVHSSLTADKLAGNPAANSFWATDENGVQGWIASPFGNMNSSIYDPENTGKIQKAETADKLAGTPLPHQVWATNNLGRQVWQTLNISDVMLKSEFASFDTTNKIVDNAKTAEQIKSGLTAQNNTFYGKNDQGQFDWMPIPTNSTENAFKIADNLSSENTAANSTFYGKGLDGTVGFKEISEISAQVMLKSTYDPENTGHFALPVTEETVPGSVWSKTSEGQGWTLPTLKVVTGSQSSITIPEGNWVVLYTENRVPKSQNVIGPSEFTWEAAEDDVAWALKI